MVFGEESIDPETGEVQKAPRRVMPSHYKDPTSGTILEVKAPDVWEYSERGQEP